MAASTLYWYDFETFGADPRRDRASQFAGIRTDEDLNIIGEPLVIYCKPADDFLPNPMACLITGISPQQAAAKGLNEAEFIRSILKEFSQANTCVAGYNSIRFDDELTRQLLYRNFYDPYEREWKNGNSRWDLIDMLRLCAATRPEGINWPQKEDGSNSFRLDQLSVANGIEHGQAHDALADVMATIEMARLIKARQPKLYDYVFKLRDKKRVQSEIDLTTKKPLLHVSMMYPARLGCLAIVMPLCPHPTNNNGVIVYDLRMDPSSWMHLTEQELRERIFTPKASLPEGVERVPLKTVHANKCPVIASPAVLPPQMAEKYEIDLERCRQHWELLQANPEVAKKISAVFSEEKYEQETDPDFMIYSGGFFSDGDRSLMQTVRATQPIDLARLDLPFRDRRLQEMLFRYRARNFPDTLNNEEIARWQEFRSARLHDARAIEHYRRDLQQAREKATAEQQSVLDELEQYVVSLQSN